MFIGTSQLGGYKFAELSSQSPIRNLVKLVISVGHEVPQLVEALRYKPEGRVFDS